MVAILGPSGSGKTSLLNMLSQRQSLSDGCLVEGEIKLNGKKM
jgi:ABC-type multidrug transport system ATPase subunit